MSNSSLGVELTQGRNSVCLSTTLKLEWVRRVYASRNDSHRLRDVLFSTNIPRHRMHFINDYWVNQLNQTERIKALEIQGLLLGCQIWKRENHDKHMEHNLDGKVRFYLEIKVRQVQGAIKWRHVGVKCGCDLDLSFSLLSVMYTDARWWYRSTWLDPMTNISQVETAHVWGDAKNKNTRSSLETVTTMVCTLKRHIWAEYMIIIANRMGILKKSVSGMTKRHEFPPCKYWTLNL